MSKIEIVEYNPSWPAQFEHLKNTFALSGFKNVLAIEHIGSTSVNGLWAKNIIDIQITVVKLDDEDLIKHLVECGCHYYEGAIEDNLVGVNPGSKNLQKHFLKYQSDISAHIHIRQKGYLNERYPILFRDYLRINKTMRLAYQQVKIELSKRFKDDSQSYYAIKDPFMDVIYTAAKQYFENQKQNSAQVHKD